MKYDVPTAARLTTGKADTILKSSWRIRRPLPQGGFTIVELMIATTVFAVILLVITMGILHFSQAYYKGVNSSTTQDAARSIIDSVAQAVQFGGGYFSFAPAPPTATTTYCIGNERFDFVLGKERENSPSGSQTKDALYLSSNSPGGCAPIAGNLVSGVTGGQELLPANTRLAKFSVNRVAGSTSLYSIDLKVAYGDDDLFCSSGKPGSCNAGAASLTPSDYSNQSILDGLTCKSQSGSQFCAVTELSTTVQTRVLP